MHPCNINQPFIVFLCTCKTRVLVCSPFAFCSFFKMDAVMALLATLFLAACGDQAANVNIVKSHSYARIWVEPDSWRPQDTIGPWPPGSRTRVECAGFCLQESGCQAFGYDELKSEPCQLGKATGRSVAFFSVQLIIYNYQRAHRDDGQGQCHSGVLQSQCDQRYESHQIIV